MNEKKRQAVALFRYGLISEFLHTELNRGEQKRRMKELARRRYDVSWEAQTIRVSTGSLKHWLGAYRKFGFDGLLPKVRRDKGTCKAIDPLLAGKIVAVKRATPTLSIPELIRSLEDVEEAVPGKLKHSTVHRLLQRHGLSGRPGLDPGHKRQRLPYRYPLPFDLWAGDVMHGRVEVCGHKVYLIAFIDSATRAIMHAAFAFDEGALSVLDVLKQALLVRGICRRLYVDHGSAFIDTRFARTCAHLGIQHLLAPVRDGAAKGSIERFFARFRSQFERYLQPEDLEDLGTLNSLLWRWIHSTYHQTPHSGIDGEKPWLRFMRLLPQVEHRRVEPDFDFTALWRTRAKRTVRRDGTVSLNGHVLEVPPTVGRRRVELRYLDEELPEGVEVWLDEEKVGPACPVDLEANASRRRWRPKPSSESTTSLPLDPLSRSRKTWKTNREDKE